MPNRPTSDSQAPAGQHVRARSSRRKPVRGRGAKSPKTERVDFILREMASGRWVPGRSGPDTAKRFGVSLKTLEADAAESSRRIRGLVMSDEDLKPMLESALLHAMRMATDAKDPARGSEALTKAAAILSGIRGFDAPKRVEVNDSALAAVLTRGLASLADKKQK